MFDWSVSVGNLLTILSFLIVATGTVYTLRGRVDAISNRLLSFEGEIRRLTDILVIQGRHEERMAAMDGRLSNQGSRLDDLTRRFNDKVD